MVTRRACRERHRCGRAEERHDFDVLGDRLKASFVSPDGPSAAAGIKEGDEIIAIDGRQVTPKYYSAGDWTRGPAGKAILLTRADGTKVKLTLTDYY